MPLRELVTKLAEAAGLDQSEIEEHLAEAQTIDLSEPLAGEAADQLEIFFSNTEKPLEKDGLLWYPMIREGQWAVRPGPQGQKVRKPLQVISGHSENARKELGLADLVSAFKDDAIEFVTVPETHNNGVLENTGFIDDMKIAKAPITKGPNKGKKVPTLFGGYRFTDANAKQKVLEGSAASRSCGILYDYVNTETGKTYPAVVEHVCLTNKPWINGMLSFGRPLAGVEGLSIDSVRFTDEEPDAETLADEEALTKWSSEQFEQISEELAAGDVAWDEVGSSNWVREQADKTLRALRDQHRLARQAQMPGGSGYVEWTDDFPSFRVCDTKPLSASAGSILVSDGYSDNSDSWVVPYTIDENEQLEIQALTSWTKVKKIMVEDDNGPTAAQIQEAAGASPGQADVAYDDSPRGKLKRARDRRKEKTSDRTDLSESPTTHPRGGEQHMDDKEKTGDLQLSEDARNRIAELEAENKKKDDKISELGEKVTKLSTDSQSTKTAEFIDGLKAMGFDEEHGFGGMLVEIETAMLEDDGDAAVVSEKFAQEGQTGEVALSLSEVLQRVFGAVVKGEDGKMKLSAQVPAPTEKQEPAKPGEKENKNTADLADNKPSEGSEEEKLSPSDKADALLAENPGIARDLGLTVDKTPAAAGAAAENGGGES